MSSITVNIGVFGQNYNLGESSFLQLGLTFTAARTTTSNLSEELGRLKSVVDAASAAGNISTAIDCTQKAKKREEEKVEAISKAYDKLGEFVHDIGRIDLLVAVAVDISKDNFYKKYSFLKPENEKEWYEKLADAFIGACKWVAENFESLMVVIVCIVIVIALVVVTVITFGTGALVFMAVLAGVGLASQLVADIISGEFSSWQTYLGAALGGVVTACVTLLSGGNETLANVLGDGFATFFSQHLENITGGDKRSSMAILLNTGLTMGESFLFSKFSDSLSISNDMSDTLFSNFDDYMKGMKSLFDGDTIEKITLKGMGFDNIMDVFGEGFAKNFLDGLGKTYFDGKFGATGFDLGKLHDVLVGNVTIGEMDNFTVFSINDFLLSPIPPVFGINLHPNIDINLNSNMELNLDFNFKVSAPQIMVNVLTTGFVFGPAGLLLL